MGETSKELKPYNGTSRSLSQGFQWCDNHVQLAAYLALLQIDEGCAQRSKLLTKIKEWLSNQDIEICCDLYFDKQTMDDTIKLEFCAGFAVGYLWDQRHRESPSWCVNHARVMKLQKFCPRSMHIPWHSRIKLSMRPYSWEITTHMLLLTTSDCFRMGKLSMISYGCFLEIKFNYIETVRELYDTLNSKSVFANRALITAHHTGDY